MEWDSRGAEWRQGARPHGDDSRRLFPAADRPHRVDQTVGAAGIGRGRGPRYELAAAIRRSVGVARGIPLSRYLYPSRRIAGRGCGDGDGEAIRTGVEAGVDGAARHAGTVAAR